jgi:glutamate-1-semialdehyde 2,1-aminomutase
MVIEKAYDCYIVDESGKQLIDTSMGSGAQIIGHNNPLIRKIGKQIFNGTIYTIANSHTQRVNYLLKKYINPELHSEYIFCNTGTEANMRAIRLARAYTGRNKIAKFHGGWHGGLDGFIESRGVPNSSNELITTLPYNEDACFEKITSELAAVIVEPAQGSNPRSDIGSFIAKVQKECKRKRVLLILDEVMTGFRLAKRGGAGVFNLAPDIITYGKILGGGFPLGAVGATEEIISTPNVFYGGTFSSNPLSMYGAKLILQTITEESGDKKYIDYSKLQSASEYFRDELNSFFKSISKPLRVMGCGSVNRIIFTDKFIKNRKERDAAESQNQEKFYTLLQKEGVFINKNGLIHLSMCHLNVIDNIIDAIKRTSRCL